MIDINSKTRNKMGTMTSIVGIICNTVLSFFKILVGFLTANISVIADGVNNISDVGTAGVALFSFQLSKKPENKKHPFGYARVEYIASLIISILIFFVAFELISSSIKSIIKPSEIQFSGWVLAILIVSIFVKIGMFVFYKIMAKKEKSMVIDAMRVDSLCDVAATSTILMAYVISRFVGFNLDGYVGIAVSLFILYSGIKILIESFSSLLGEKPSDKLVNFICDKMSTYQDVLGIHDLVIHTYGFGKVYATIDAEIDANMDLVSSHEIVDKIEREFYNEGVHLVIHIDPIILDDKRVNKYRKETIRIVEEINPDFKIHDFRAHFGNKTYLYFDIETPMDCKMPSKVIMSRIAKAYEMYNKDIVLSMRVDMSYLPVKNNRKVKIENLKHRKAQKPDGKDNA